MASFVRRGSADSADVARRTRHFVPKKKCFAEVFRVLGSLACVKRVRLKETKEIERCDVLELAKKKGSSPELKREALSKLQKPAIAPRNGSTCNPWCRLLAQIQSAFTSAMPCELLQEMFWGKLRARCWNKPNASECI